MSRLRQLQDKKKIITYKLCQTFNNYICTDKLRVYTSFWSFFSFLLLGSPTYTKRIHKGVVEKPSHVTSSTPCNGEQKHL